MKVNRWHIIIICQITSPMTTWIGGVYFFSTPILVWYSNVCQRQQLSTAPTKPLCQFIAITAVAPHRSGIPYDLSSKSNKTSVAQSNPSIKPFCVCTWILKIISWFLFVWIRIVPYMPTPTKGVCFVQATFISRLEVTHQLVIFFVEVAHW